MAPTVTNEPIEERPRDGRIVAERSTAVQETVRDGLESIGVFAGAIAALIVFTGIYVWAIRHEGWVIGIALGWIPAGLGALAAGIVIVWLFASVWWWVLLCCGLVWYLSA
jgi:hypothetical protein